MEEREGTNTTGFGLKQHGPPDGYLMDPLPRPENLNPFPGSTSSAVAAKAAESAAPPFSLTMPTDNSSSDLKKKRGRPRKYNPDGTLAVTLSPMPISSSVPLTAELSASKRGRGRGRGRSSKWLKKSQMFEFGNQDLSKAKYMSVGSAVASVRNADFLGANFTPYVLTVNAGEDVTMKVMMFSQQGSRAICVLSATGSISNVTIRQSMTSGGTLTYEGRFEILSLTGSFMPNESGGTRSRAGGMSVSLAGPDGRVFGGGLAGLFIAAAPVQVVVGSFIMGQEQEAHQKKQKRNMEVPSAAPLTSISFGSAEESRASYERLKPVVPMPPASFSHENSGLTNAHPVHNYYTNTANHIKDLFASLPEEEENEREGDDDEEEEFGGDSQSNTEIPS